MPARKDINKELFLELYNRGLKDSEISKYLNVNRHKIGKFRASLELEPNNYYLKERHKEEILKLLNLGYSDTYIGNKFKIPRLSIANFRKANNIEPIYNGKITPEKEEILLDLYLKGYMDSEIASLLEVTHGAISNYRKTHNLPTKFNYQKLAKYDYTKFKELFDKGLDDVLIAKELGITKDGVYGHRIRFGLYRDSLRINKEIPLTLYQKEVLIGTVLGDSYLSKITDNSNARLVCAHCIAQKDLIMYKADIFESIGAKVNYHKRQTPDKRNGKYYECYRLDTPANPALTYYRNKFYINNKKIIPMDLMLDFSAVSLAFMFMDDGYIHSSSYGIATMCFSREEVLLFTQFLYNKFLLQTTIHKDNSIYIRKASKERFELLVSPYIIDCMKYKLHTNSPE